MSKYFQLSFIIFAGLLVFNMSNSYAQGMQNYQGPAVIITTMEMDMPEDGSIAEFDSLNQLYTDKVIKKNDLIQDFKMLRHWWGHNNQDMLMMYEVKTWNDILAANQKNNELFEQTWTTEEARAAFNKAYNKYFTGKHSDEIYSVVKSGTK